MASLESRNGWFHISYYQNNKRQKCALKIRDNRMGRKEAEKILTDVEWFLGHNIPVDISSIKRNLLQNGNGQLLVQPVVEQPKVVEEEKPLTLLQGWEKYSAIKKKDKKSNYYRALMKLIELIGDIPIKQVTDEHAVKFESILREKNLKDYTIHNYFAQLITIWNFFIKKKLASEQPFYPIGTTEKPVVVIPESEIKLILDHLNNYENRLNYFLIKLLYMTGMRISEALSFSKTDIDFKNNIILIKNTKKHRDEQFPIYNTLEPFLRQLVSEVDDEIFFNKYTARTAWDMFKKTCRELKIKSYKLHDLRRTFATQMASKLSQTELQTVVRHKSVATTMKHYVNHNIQEIANKMI